MRRKVQLNARAARQRARRGEARRAREVDAWVSRLRSGRAPRPLGDPEVRRAAAVAALLHAAFLREAGPSAHFVQRIYTRFHRARPDLAGMAPPRSPGIIRRHLLLAGLGGGAALAAGVAVAAVLGPWRRVGAGAALLGWIRVGPLDRFPAGTVSPVMAGNAFVFVVGHADGPVALSGLCTDVGCPLAYSQRENRLVCPCHGAVFTLAGAMVPGTYWSSLPPLSHVPLRVEDGWVQLQPGAVAARGTP